MLCYRALVFLFAVNVPIVTGLVPDFLYPLRNVTIQQGRDAIFNCALKNIGGYRVSPSSPENRELSGINILRVAWVKQDTMGIIAIHEHVLYQSKRYTVKYNKQNTWTLKIRSVKRIDAGHYTCQINTMPAKSQGAYLRVVVPPDIVAEETSTDLMVPEGGSAKLVCKARGYPKPDIVWKREDGGDIITRTGFQGKMKAPTTEGELLTFDKITRNEMGAYLCIASNGIPPSVSKRILLQVHFHPLVQVPNQLVGAPTGTNVTLVCHVEASPKAINYWTRESGEMIIGNSKHVMTERKVATYGTHMKLIIVDLQKEDLGGYKCLSKNSIGEAEGNIRLYDMKIPKSTTKIGDRRTGNEKMSEFTSPTDHSLVRVHQGSLREADTTLKPYADDDDDVSSSSTSSTLADVRRSLATLFWVFLHVATNRLFAV